MSQITIPAGFKQDAKGSFVPLTKIKPVDLARDDLVNGLVAEAKQLSAALTKFKNAAFGDIEAFIDLSAEQYDATIGGAKGNASLISFDGRYKIERAMADTITFDERLIAAKSLIDQCIVSWSVGANDNVRVLVNDAFNVDRAGKINTGRVLGLRRLDISDEKWKRAMDAISDAVQVTGSKSYLRFYERVGDTDQWEAISLNVATL